MVNYASHFRAKGPTPQSEAIVGREQEQVANNAGGFVFKLDEWAQLDRFLILGSEGGTYYANERKLTIDNAKNVQKCISGDGVRVVNRVVEISDSGRAPKNDGCLFVLALCASSPDVKTRQAALAALPSVARIGTHLFHFAEFVNAQRGWGRALKRAVGNWYLNQPRDNMAYGMVKYQQRDGWSHRDLLRLSHPKTTSFEYKEVFDWVCGRNKENDHLPSIIRAFEILKATPTPEVAIDAILNYNLPREAIPTQLLNDVGVWKALLKNMPITALVRNLGKMTSIGVIKPLSKELALVTDKLRDAELIKKSRLHPLAILIALKIYSQGKGDKGSLTWAPIAQVVDALNDAFYLAFGNVPSTGKNIMLALDVSGSMGSSIAGSPLSCREATAALALVTANVEKNYFIMGFSKRFIPLNISPNMRLDQAVNNIKGLPFEGTDCSLPMLHAIEHKLDVDGFVVYTDNETWAGTVHPTEALRAYRARSGRAAKEVVVGMTASPFTIADPTDGGQLDVVGFDTSTPQIISDFIRG